MNGETVLLVLLLLAGINLLAFALFWRDKHSARTGGWRVREDRLLLIALVGGSIGAVAGQQWLRHKTRKEPFRTRLQLIIVVQIGLIVGLFAFR